MAAPQYGYLLLDPDILAAVVRTRIEHRCPPEKKSGAHRPVAKLRSDNPFLVPTPPEQAPWTKKKITRGRTVRRHTTLIAAIVWAMMMGFVAVAYALHALHAPLADFPTP